MAKKFKDVRNTRKMLAYGRDNGIGPFKGAPKRKAVVPVPAKERWIDRYAEIFGTQPNKEMIDLFDAAARCTWQEITEVLVLRSKELEDNCNE